MNYQDKTPVKAGDKVKGPDWHGRTITGTAVAGDKALGQREFILKHDVGGRLCPSLNLENFLPQKETVGAGGNTPTAAEPKAAP